MEYLYDDRTARKRFPPPSRRLPLGDRIDSVSLLGKKTKKTPVNSISLLQGYCSISSYMFSKSELLSPYPLKSCTCLTSGYTIARQKHRFAEKHFFKQFNGSRSLKCSRVSNGITGFLSFDKSWCFCPCQYVRSPSETKM